MKRKEPEITPKLLASIRKLRIEQGWSRQDISNIYCVGIAKQKELEATEPSLRALHLRKGRPFGGRGFYVGLE